VSDEHKTPKNSEPQSDAEMMWNSSTKLWCLPIVSPSLVNSGLIHCQLAYYWN